MGKNNKQQQKPAPQQQATKPAAKAAAPAPQPKAAPAPQPKAAQKPTPAPAATTKTAPQQQKKTVEQPKQVEQPKAQAKQAQPKQQQQQPKQQQPQQQQQKQQQQQNTNNKRVTKPQDSDDDEVKPTTKRAHTNQKKTAREEELVQLSPIKPQQKQQQQQQQQQTKSAVKQQQQQQSNATQQQPSAQQQKQTKKQAVVAPPVVESSEEEEEDEELQFPPIFYSFIASKYPDLLDGDVTQEMLDNLIAFEMSEGEFVEELMNHAEGELSPEDIASLSSFFGGAEGEDDAQEGEVDFGMPFEGESGMNFFDFGEGEEEGEDFSGFEGEFDLDDDLFRSIIEGGEGEEGEFPAEGELTPEQLMAMYGGEGELTPEQLMALYGGEGELTPEQLMALYGGEGELTPEQLMAMYGGEGEFDFGEGEMDFGELSADEDEDDEANRSENDDLDELLSLEANPNTKKKTADKKKTTKKSKNSMNDDDSDEDSDFDEIQAEFNFHDPDNEKDWHATKKFVSTLIDKKDFNASEFADLITQQAIVGTTIKCPDAGDEPLGFISVISMKEYEKKESVRQIKDYIINNAGNDKNKATLKQLFTKENIGLIVTDRVVNLPMEVVPPLYNELLKDIQHAAQQQKGKWKFTYYILISPCCETGGMTQQKGKKKAGAAAANDDNNQAASAEVWYTRFEDEFFAKHAVISRKVQTSLMKPWMDTGKLPVQNMILIMKQTALGQVRDHLAKVIGIGGEETSF